MKRTTLIVGLSILMMTVGFPATGSSQNAAAGKTLGGWWTSSDIQQTLGLSQQQIEQIDAIEKQQKENQGNARRNVATAVRKYLAALDAGAEASELLVQRQQELDQAWARHLEVTTDYWRTLRALLNEEQWLKLPEVAPKAIRLGMLGVRQRVPAGR
jgi:Spy/CpxP family protein refolding chaperone